MTALSLTKALQKWRQTYNIYVGTARELIYALRIANLQHQAPLVIIYIYFSYERYSEVMKLTLDHDLEKI